MKGGKDGNNGVVEAIYKLKCVIFVLQNTGKKLRTRENAGESQGISL